MYKFTLDQQKNIINDYNIMRSTRKVGNKWNIDRDVVKRILRENNKEVYLSKKVFSKQDILIIKKMYKDNNNLNTISSLFSTHRKRIKDILVDNGVSIRGYTSKYNFDKSFFKEIDSSIKAYFLGFIFADGCIFEGKKKVEPYGLSIIIQERDREIIDNLKYYLKSDHPVRFIDPQKKTWQRKIGLTITSKEFVKWIVEKGGTPRKSATCIFPNNHIPEKFLKDFVRGYFDGDGCITASTRYYAYPHVSICVSKFFGESLKKIVYDKIGIQGSLLYKKSEIYNFSLQKKRAMAFLHWLYDNSSISLGRKYKRFLFFKKFYENQKGKKIRKIRSSKWNLIKQNAS